MGEMYLSKTTLAFGILGIVMGLDIKASSV